MGHLLPSEKKNVKCLGGEEDMRGFEIDRAIMAHKLRKLFKNSMQRYIQEEKKCRTENEGRV